MKFIPSYFTIICNKEISHFTNAKQKHKYGNIKFIIKAENYKM